jgi:WD40 repeat protein
VLSLAFTRDGQTLASGSDDETIKLWNMNDGKLAGTFKGQAKHVYAVAFSPDNKRLMSGCKDRDDIGEFFQNFFGTSKTING